jgi:predicted nucleic acid-binding protein
MITFVDTSVLIAIDLGEGDAAAWLAMLGRCRGEGVLCIGEVVAAEFFAVVQDEAEFREILADLGIEYRSSSAAAAMVAGGIFRRYREQGGPREHLIPDFLVAAQAAVDGRRLVAKDRGYLRRYFPKLEVLAAGG